MEVKEFKDTTRFAGPNEVYNYLELLGAEYKGKIDGDPTYILDGIKYQYWGEYNSVFLPNGFPEGIEQKLNKSPFKSYYYGHNICNLEALAYYYTLITSGEKNIEENYKKNFEIIRLAALQRESDERAKQFYRRIKPMTDENSSKVVNDLREKITKMQNIVYPFNIPEFKENLENFKDKTEFHIKSFDGYLGFNWSFRDENGLIIEGEFYSREFLTARINVCNKDNTEYLEQFSYYLSSNDNKITHYQSNGFECRKVINLNENEFTQLDETRTATDEDYKEAIELLDKYFEKIIEFFPYLDPKGYKERERKEIERINEARAAYLRELRSMYEGKAKTR